MRSDRFVARNEQPGEGLSTPSRWRLLREARALPDLFRSLFELPTLSAQPRANGEPVLVLPGFGTGDRATVVLRRYLGGRGYRVRGWGLGRNRGNVPALIPRLIASADGFARETRLPVRLVGWSLGGNLAREVARERPELVERVVTLGTPVVGGPKYTAMAGSYARRGYDLSEIEASIEERNRTPIRVPITAIFSRWDGVVAWRACIDRSSPQVEHVEVRCGHFGLLFSSEVCRELSRCLAADQPRPPSDRA